MKTLILWFALYLNRPKKRYIRFNSGNYNELAHASQVDFLNPNRFPTPEEQESYLAGPKTMADFKREVYEQRSKRA